MFQNLGELITYIGIGLCVLSIATIVLIQIVNRVMNGRFATNTMGLVFGACFILGLVLFFAGEQKRISMSKDVVLKYYNDGVAYEDLSEKQTENVVVAYIEYKQMSDAEKAKYYDSIRHYFIQYRIETLDETEESATETVDESLK